MSAVTPLDVFACELSGTTLIEASAGTGKTWNICALVLRLLLERPLPIRQILVVTFTKAATAELRARVRARIVETLAAVRGVGQDDPFVSGLLAAARRAGVDDAQIEQRLALARSSFDEAAIHTIHGFCQRALADVPFAAQLPMTLELLENDGDLRREVVNDFWRRRVGAPALSAEIVECVVSGRDSPDTWDRLLARRLAKPLSALLWPDDAGQPAVIDLAALRDAHARARTEWRARKDAILGALTQRLGALKANIYNPDSLKSAALDWERLLFPEDPVSTLQAKALKAELLGFAKLEKSTKNGQATPRDPFFPLAQALLEARATAAGAATATRLAMLKALLDEGVETVRRRKRERRLVAFDDMLYNLHERLADPASPWLAATLRERYPAALIDEFQDTDPLQFAIFERIYIGCGAPLFLVGDPKQAIYSFRNADLHTYLGARRHATTQTTLAHNQRSSPALIGALNALFARNRDAFVLPGLDYHPVSPGTRPRSVFVDRTEPRAALHVWTLPTREGAGLRKDSAADAASAACAAEIARLLRGADDGAVTLDGRPLRAGDVAVLVRTHRQGNLIREALRALGIGSVEVSQASVFHTSDAEELERVLLAVLEPARERLLRAALATEVLGRDAADIDALSQDEGAIADVMLRFAGYRELWLRQGIAPMLRRFMADERVGDRLLVRPDGERRMTNVLHLTERLQDACAEHRSPQALLRWLRRMRTDERGSEAAQLRLDSDRNLVQIVTVHKAKGLEYPLVFCPYLWDVAAPPDRGDGVEYHDNEHRPVVDFRPQAKQDDEIKLRVKIERAAEDLRLVYVALTRAVHRCCIVAGCYGERSVTLSARGMLNWLVAGEGMTPEDWFGHKLGGTGIADAWSRLAAAAPEQIAVQPLPRTAGTPIDVPRPAPDDIRALAAPDRIPAGWHIGSFSAMLLGGADTPGADHDVHVGTPAAAVAVGGDDILAFPRGMDAGTCLHAMLERCDFCDPSTWSAAVRTALAMHPQPLAGADAGTRLERMALSMIGDVVRTPLPGGFALQDVAPARRLNELEFHLPSRYVHAAALRRLLERHGYVTPTLAAGALDGYLNGFIDMVFEHDGRYYVLDWKSNHLGTTPDAYGPDGLQAAMALHGYHLQSLLYCVALERHLALRLPDYDRDRHFGGVLYLFVRGVRPGWQVDGRPAGVYFHRPRSDVIDALSSLLRHRETSA